MSFLIININLISPWCKSPAFQTCHMKHDPVPYYLCWPILDSFKPLSFLHQKPGTVLSTQKTHKLFHQYWGETPDLLLVLFPTQSRMLLDLFVARAHCWLISCLFTMCFSVPWPSNMYWCLSLLLAVCCSLCQTSWDYFLPVSLACPGFSEFQHILFPWPRP